MAPTKLSGILFSMVCLALLAQACGPAQVPYMGSCGKTPNLELVSLAMFRDPLPEARKIDQWRAIIRSDSSDVCQTTLTLTDANSKEAISHAVKTELTLGTNEVLFYSFDDYRLKGNEVCFEVNVYISGNKVALKSPRLFCAHTMDRGWWTMR